MLDFDEKISQRVLMKKYRQKQALSTFALTEVKLTVIKGLITDVYPTLAEEAEEYLEVLKGKKKEVLGEYG